MAAFGIPGGAEWLVIVLVVLLTFVPAVAVFLGGYLVGKAKGRAESVSSGKPAAPDVPAASEPTEGDDE